MAQQFLARRQCDPDNHLFDLYTQFRSRRRECTYIGAIAYIRARSRGVGLEDSLPEPWAAMYTAYPRFLTDHCIKSESHSQDKLVVNPARMDKRKCNGYDRL